MKTISTPPSGGLDFNFSSDEEFSPDKLRANGERLYTTVIVGMLYFFKHVSRLQSWNEPARTSYFASIYFLAWINNSVGYLVLIFLVAIITFPPSREFLFPPIPLALVDSNSGNLQTPPAKALGSGESLTGAGEVHKGEAVEREASNFVRSFMSMAIQSTAGAQDSDASRINEREEEEADDKGLLDNITPDPGDLPLLSADAQDVVDGEMVASDGKNGVKDQTKKPVERMVWNDMRLLLSVLKEICDT